MKPQLAMHAFEFLPSQRNAQAKQQVQFQSSLFNDAIAITAQEMSNAGFSDQSEFTANMEFSVRQSVFSVNNQLTVDSQCDLNAIRFANSSQNSSSKEGRTR